MASTRVLHRAFSGGQVSPEMLGHVDDAHYQNGAARLRNVISRPQGPVRSRPGLRFVGKAHDSATRVRLIPFKFSANQELVLQFGRAIVDGRSIGHIRIHTLSSTVLYTMPSRAWVQQQGFSASSGAPFTNGVDLAGNQILISQAHGLGVADPIAFTTSGTGVLPTPLLPLTIYYAVVVDAVTIKVATTAANATANPPVVIDLTALGAGISGERTVHFAYAIGDMVQWTGVVPSPGVFLCNQLPWFDHTDHPLSDTNFWYREPGSSSQVTASPVTNRFTWSGHGLIAGAPVSFSGVTPSAVVPDTTYYVLAPTTTDFQISGVPFGSFIPLITSGSNITALANAIYETTHPFADADLFDFTYDQSGDVLSLAHPNYLPTEIRRLGATTWAGTLVRLGPTLTAPTIASVTGRLGEGIKIAATTTDTLITSGVAHGFVRDLDTVYVTNVPTLADGLYVVGDTGYSSFKIKTVESGVLVTYSVNASIDGRARATSLSSDAINTYEVTAAAQDGTESVASAPVAISTNNLFVSGATNTITWGAVTGALRYRIYKKRNGLFGYIGQVDAPSVSFIDDNISPDLGITPPIQDTSLTQPGAVGHFEQRRVWAGTPQKPQDVWATKTGTESDLSFSLPLQDSDRIQFRIASRQRATIRHIAPLDQLLLLTDVAEYRVTPFNGDSFTPGSVSVRAQSYIGSSGVTPVIVNNSLVFCAARGGHLREMGFRQESWSYLTGDLSLRATDLFDGLTLVDMTYAKSPHPVVWAVSSSGKLLGLTYVPEESVGGWHQHDTDGVFESVCAVGEGSEDAVYVVVKRTVNGQSVRYVEVMATQAEAPLFNSFFVDAGVTYAGLATSIVPGLTHLEAKTVAVLADGVPTTKVVSGGQITLTTPASTVQVGLAYTAEVLTLPITAQLDAMGQGRTKNVNRAWVRVVSTKSCKVGSDALSLVPADPDATGLATRQIEVRLPGGWSDGGQILVQQPDPLPMTVVGLTLEVAIGG